MFQSPNQLNPESSGSANKSSTASVDSAGFESIDAIFANVENALESELALILDPLPISKSFVEDHPNETISFENNTTSTSANCDVGSDEAISGFCEIDSAVDSACQDRLRPSNHATHSHGTQRNLPIESLNEFIGGCLESNGHAFAKSDGIANDPKHVKADVLQLGDDAGPAHQAVQEINPISVCFNEGSPCQQGDEGLNTYPPESSTYTQKYSASDNGPDNCERDSAENKLVQREELLPLDGPGGSVPVDAFCAESVEPPAIAEIESERVSIQELAIKEVGFPLEMDDPSPEHAESNTLVQNLPSSVDAKKMIVGDDDPSILQSVSPDEASPNNNSDLGVEPKDPGYRPVNVSKPDNLLVQSDVDVHSSSCDDRLLLPLPVDGDTRRLGSSSPMGNMPNDGDNDGENVITTSWSSETPDGFDELNQLFKEAENQLETELAATLGISGSSDRESNIKHDSPVTTRTPTTPVSVSSLKVSMLSRRKVAAATGDAQYSPTTQAPGFKWLERLQNSKNKAD